MGKINWTGVLTGGLLAGLVINVGEFTLNTFVIGESFAARMNELGLAMPDSGSAMVVWVILSFVLGIASVWLYAAIRPRYGPGIKTAIYAGAAVWFFSGLLNGVGMVNAGLFSAGLMAAGIIWGLVELCIATALGAWVYKEGETSAAAAEAT